MSTATQSSPPMPGAPGAPAAKAENFGASMKRLLGRLGPQRVAVMFVLILAVSSVVLSVIGPRLMAMPPTSSSTASSAGSCPRA